MFIDDFSFITEFIDISFKSFQSLAISFFDSAQFIENGFLKTVKFAFTIFFFSIVETTFEVGSWLDNFIIWEDRFSWRIDSCVAMITIDIFLRNQFILYLFHSVHNVIEALFLLCFFIATFNFTSWITNKWISKRYKLFILIFDI